VADRVHAAILTRGKATRGIAPELGINRSTLQRRINNPRKLTLAEVAQIAAALDVHPDEFIGGFEPV
jgi:plasmid maintenance system antidote protein VapI